MNEYIECSTLEEVKKNLNNNVIIILSDVYYDDVIKILDYTIRNKNNILGFYIKFSGILIYSIEEYLYYNMIYLHKYILIFEMGSLEENDSRIPNIRTFLNKYIKIIKKGDSINYQKNEIFSNRIYKTDKLTDILQTYKLMYKL